MQINKSRNQFATATFISFLIVAVTASQSLTNSVAQSLQQQQSDPSQFKQSPMTGTRGLRMWGWGPESQYGNMYDPQKVETIRGKVVDTNTFVPMNRMSRGIQLQIDTGKQTINVHLGPGWYLDDQGFQVTTGDEVEITGSQVNWAGNPVMMAAEVRHGNQVLKLRDSNGIPLWSRWHRRSGDPCCSW